MCEIEEYYNDISFVVRTDEPNYVDELKRLGGRWNPNLIGGSGWIFNRRRHREKVASFIAEQNKKSRCESLIFYSIFFGGILASWLFF